MQLKSPKGMLLPQEIVGIFVIVSALKSGQDFPHLNWTSDNLVCFLEFQAVEKWPDEDKAQPLEMTEIFAIF